MDKIYVLQNEIENLTNKLSKEMNATDDEKIVALQLALGTLYKMKNARNAYLSVMNNQKENSTDGN